LNQYLKGFGVKIADSILVRKGMSVDSQSIADELGLPCFVKPNGAGSSFGVTKCKSAADILPAIEKAHEECDEVLIESLLEGMEVSNGVYRKKDGTINVLPITEIVSHNEYFDFNAKYNGEVEEITPARLSDETTSRVQALTSHIYDILGARGIIRVDYFISKKQNSDGSEVDVITLLEINGTPGMTPTSFIPQQAAAAGLEMKDVLNEVISI
jgi:D-alanine-D-alanine ligase